MDSYQNLAYSKNQVNQRKLSGYTACYRSDHTLLYKTATEDWIGWWHLSGSKESVADCRGLDPRRVACRLVKKVDEQYYGVGASSGSVRYRFTIGAPPQ